MQKHKEKKEKDKLGVACMYIPKLRCRLLLGCPFYRIIEGIGLVENAATRPCALLRWHTRVAMRGGCH